MWRNGARKRNNSPGAWPRGIFNTIGLSTRPTFRWKKCMRRTSRLSLNTEHENGPLGGALTRIGLGRYLVRSTSRPSTGRALRRIAQPEISFDHPDHGIECDP